jgi:radical SAM superfamily enzyme YgiQ (UPF0313 family)
MEHAVNVIRKTGIEVHGMFIFGFDADEECDLEATMRFALKVPITTAQFLILTPFPGTDLFTRFKRENRILSSDWNLYDGHHVVFKPLNLEPLELQDTQVRAHWGFYSWLRSLANLARFRFARAAIYIYARKNNSTWKELNRSYLKALDPLSGDRPLALHPQRNFPDIVRAIQNARLRSTEVN